MKIEDLPVIDVDESEEITVAVRADDLLEGDTADPEQHPIAIALRRQDDVDDARVTKKETLVRPVRSGFATTPRISNCSRRLRSAKEQKVRASSCVARKITRGAWSASGAQGRNRTTDTVIFSD